MASPVLASSRETLNRRRIRLSKIPRRRADASRNRERLVAEARRSFAAGDAKVSLEAVARASGVGIATLYRHFPTREALVEAAYCSELDALTADAKPLLAAHRALDALRIWMDRYAGFVDAKHAMRDALRIALTSPSASAPETRSRIRAVVALFMAAGAEDGTIRVDVEPDDVTLSLAGAVLMTSTSSDAPQLQRLFDLLLDGLRPRP